jgi:hypothetical protein
LWTTLAPRQLRFTSTDQWDFWFRDLPAAEDTATFTRSASHSVQRRGVNNPAAQTRRLVHLNGYEWRLGAGDKAPLPLGPLQFYPLSLGGSKPGGCASPGGPRPSWRRLAFQVQHRVVSLADDDQFTGQSARELVEAFDAGGKVGEVHSWNTIVRSERLSCRCRAAR